MGEGHANFDQLIDSWYNEVYKFNVSYGDPYSSSWGHYIQVTHGECVCVYVCACVRVCVCVCAGWGVGKR